MFFLSVHMTFVFARQAASELHMGTTPVEMKIVMLVLICIAMCTSSLRGGNNAKVDAIKERLMGPMLLLYGWKGSGRTRCEEEAPLWYPNDVGAWLPSPS